MPPTVYGFMVEFDAYEDSSDPVQKQHIAVIDFVLSGSVAPPGSEIRGIR